LLADRNEIGMREYRLRMGDNISHGAFHVGYSSEIGYS
jgi:hypothetical protein